MKALFAAALSSCLFPVGGKAEEPQVPTMIEEAATSGIDFTFRGEWEFIVGGGTAIFDCSGDGLPEIFLSGGTGAAALYLNRSTPDALSFVPHDSGLEQAMVSGAYALDVDADAITDIVLLRVGENVVMRGLGDCRFERANEMWSFEGGDAWTAAFAATWEAGASWPTMAIGNYIDRTRPDMPWGSCTANWLHRPADEGKGFAPPLDLTPSFCALSMLFTDWNRQGTPALRVSNDREYYEGGEEQMWALDAGEAPRLLGVSDGWERLRIWGMGIASNDLDGDSFPEYFLTSMSDNKLQRLKSPGPETVPQYVDTAYRDGVTAHRPYSGDDLRPSTAWHAQFEDVNSDGLVDLFIAKGNVWDMPDFAERDPNNLLLQRRDGTFVEAGDASGAGSPRQARGAAIADLNLDGRPDIVVVNRNEPVELFRNAGPAGKWLAVDPVQPGANRNAINGWIEVRTDDRVQRREITVGGGHAGGPFGPVHFGLGAATAADGRVIWPDGEVGDWLPMTVGTVNRIVRSPG